MGASFPEPPGLGPNLGELWARLRELERTVASFVAPPLDVTNGDDIDVNPTGIISIGAGLILAQPVAGTAAISMPTEREWLTDAGGGPTDIDDGDEVTLPWAHAYADELLDVSTEIAPTIRGAGRYAFAFRFGSGTPPSDFTATSMFQARFEIDTAVGHNFGLVEDAKYPARLNTLWCSMAGVFDCDADAALDIKVYNGTGFDGLSFGFACYIAKLAAY